MISLHPTFTRSILLSFLFLSCGGEEVDADSTGTTGSNAGNASTPLSITDLSGSWVGTFSPTLPPSADRVAYMRFDEYGQLYELVDSESVEWSAGNSEMAQLLSAEGAFSSTIVSNGYTKLSAQTLTGAMDATGRHLAGVYQSLHDDGSASLGTFSFVRSFPGAFSLENHIQGTWSGPAFDETRGAFLSVEFDAFGSVLGGEVRYNELPSSRVVHSILGDFTNQDAMLFTNDEVGRFDNVVLNGSDGTLTTFRYVLVSFDGKILAGPGEDSVLGPGHARLSRDL